MTNIISYLSTILLFSIGYGMISGNKATKSSIGREREVVQEMRLINRVSLQIKIEQTREENLWKITGESIMQCQIIEKMMWHCN